MTFHEPRETVIPQSVPEKEAYRGGRRKKKMKKMYR
jgi:hypothetical protein